MAPALLRAAAVGLAALLPFWGLPEAGAGLGGPLAGQRRALRFGEGAEGGAANRTFKILQLADLHYANGAATECLDVTPDQQPCTDLNTTAFVARLLDAERPDLVVLTGDNVFSKDCEDVAASQRAWRRPLEAAGVPWAIVFGNHDSEAALSRADLMRIDMEAELSLSRPGPAEVPGVGK